MSFNVARQEKYSRGQLLLRTLLGAFYIGIPHFFVLLFVSIWAGILMFVNFWIVLFTAKFPEGIFSFFLRLFQWEARLMASLGNRLVLKSDMPSEKQILFWDRYFVPLSRIMDPLFGRWFGRSIIAIWKKV